MRRVSITPYPLTATLLARGAATLYEVQGSWAGLKAQEALREASPADFRNVHVDTMNALVRLSGSAPNAETKQAAERIAKDIQNVREVENEIEVR